MELKNIRREMYCGCSPPTPKFATFCVLAAKADDDGIRPALHEGHRLRLDHPIGARRQAGEAVPPLIVRLLIGARGPILPPPCRILVLQGDGDMRDRGVPGVFAVAVVVAVDEADDGCCCRRR